MLEWFAVGLPVGLTALVFSLALTTDPNHVEVRSLTTSESAEARGYSAERLAIQLGNDIQHIVQVASTHHQPKSIEVGIADEPVEHLVDYFDLSPFVEAVQEYIGGVLYFTDIALVDDEMGDPLLDINVRRIENTQIVFADAIETKNGRIDDAVKTAAEIIVKITEPYIYASYLHNVYKHGKEKQSLYELIDFLKITLPPATNDEKIWYFNLLGIAAYETGRYDIAIGFYQEALKIDPDFALAEVNMGRALHDLGLDEEALEYYRSALQDGDLSDVSIGYVYWAQSLVAQGEIKDALAKLAVAERLTPDLALTYEIRADILEREGHTEVAGRQRRYARYARIRQPRQSFYEPV